MINFSRKFFARRILLFFLFIVSGCASSPPIPELMAASTPNPQTPPTISGPLLEACSADYAFAPHFAVDPQAVYSQSYTYGFAEKLYNLPKRVSIYANRIRAYSITAHGQDMFGTEIAPKSICYYEFSEGKMRYLTTLQPNKDGRVNVTDGNKAVLKAYALMAGKSVLKVQVFGIYAD